jgi:serine/threonine-protein kinase
MTWNPGDKLQNGKYKIKQVLGEGGFGITYQAYHSYLDTDVVIKTPNDKLRNDSEYKRFKERFLKESQILAKFSEKRHPHIVQVKDFFAEGDLPCLVMEFVRGKSLLDYVREKGVLSESQAVQYIRQIGGAINLIHGLGLVHRDAHPGNIMLVSQNEAILIDFGIAADLKPISSSTSHPYNPAFAPYEQMLGSCEKTVDVYTLAASLYYGVTGKIPQPNLYARSQGQSLIPPQNFNKNINSKLNQAIVKGLEFKSEKRPQSIEEWLDMFPITVTISTYEKLQKLLAAGEWKAADQETARVILQVAGREKQGWLDEDSIKKFPCEDLRTIDQLWVKYSNGRFGFSMQKNIWLKCGGKVDYKTEYRLCRCLGWINDRQWLKSDEKTFSLEAPLGHLPTVPIYSSYTIFRGSDEILLKVGIAAFGCSVFVGIWGIIWGIRKISVKDQEEWQKYWDWGEVWKDMMLLNGWMAKVFLFGFLIIYLVSGFVLFYNWYCAVRDWWRGRKLLRRVSSLASRTVSCNI